MAHELKPSTLAVLTALAAAERAGEPRPSLHALVLATGLAQNSAVRYELLSLSDRRLIDGHGTDRRLTDDGWAALTGEAVSA